MIKEIKYKGYTAIPSDYESPDGDLAAAVNLIPKDGAIKAINMPETVGSLNNGEELLLIHVVNDGDRNLIIKNGASLYYVREGDTERVLISTFDGSDFKCSATGNVLCVYNIGMMVHFLFLRGKYITFSTDNYAITILFGLSNATVRSRADTVNYLLEDANGTSQATWQTVASQAYERHGTDGVDIYCNLSSGHTYKIDLGMSAGTIRYYAMTLYDAGGNWVRHTCGQTNVSYQFTPSFDVVRIYFNIYQTDQYDTLVNGSRSGTATISELVTEYQSSGQYTFNHNTSVNNALATIANGLLDDSKSNNRFALPFFVRYGFRMIGGDIVTISPPILIEPNTGVVPLMEVSNIQSSANPNHFNASVTAKLYDGNLAYKVRDLAKLRSLLEVDDLVDSLVIAVSNPVYLYKQGATDDEFYNGTFILTSAPQNKCFAIDGEHTISSTASYFLTLPNYTDYENRLLSASTFKIIKEIPKDEISQSDSFVNVQLDSGVLSGLAGNTSLLPDNVQNLSSYDAKYVLSYNQREHWLGIRECQFGGHDLDAMCGYVGSSNHNANYKIGIEQRENEDLQYMIRGKKQESSSNRRWFYYPNSKAVNVVVFENGNKTTLTTLNPHPYLKGAYHFGGFTSAGTDTDSNVNDGRTLIYETEANMMYVSKQGNPIVIEQRVRVGDGVLYAGASNVRPITKNQFGGVPLYAFSSDGIWGVEVATDGTYSTRQSVARDVITNIESITQIDSAVLFATERGVMMLDGHEAMCISQQINTEHPFLLSVLGSAFTTFLSAQDAQIALYSPVPFRTFLQNCRMVYDYVNQCIVVYNPTKRYAYTYSIEQKQWGLMVSNLLYSVNSYPASWAVDNSNNIVNFSDATPNASPINGLLITRPLKLDAPDVLKTIDTVLQRGVFRDKTVQSATVKPIKTILYGSRDLYNWQLVYSSTDHRLRGFRGTPYKYFRIVLLTHLAPDESITGCAIQFTPRLLDQPR